MVAVSSQGFEEALLLVAADPQNPACPLNDVWCSRGGGLCAGLASRLLRSPLGDTSLPRIRARRSPNVWFRSRSFKMACFPGSLEWKILAVNAQWLCTQTMERGYLDGRRKNGSKPRQYGPLRSGFLRCGLDSNRSHHASVDVLEDMAVKGEGPHNLRVTEIHPQCHARVLS
jgi:hypothetical protein